MEEYKKYVDHQHAPESLIADTIKKVKAEEARKAQTQEAAKVTRMPQAAEMPCPKLPVDISTPGTTFMFGCPCK